MAFRPHINETTLLLQAAEGNEYAFTELFYWYYKELGRRVYQITDSQELTEEIVQDAFVKIWLRKETLKGIHNFGAYLFTICRNETFGALKKIAAEKVFRVGFERYLGEEIVQEQSDNPVEELRAMIATTIAKLPPQQQKIFIMSRYDRLKYDEIAAKLGLSSATVKKHIQLATKFIYQNLANQRPDASLIIILTTPLFLK